jgi:hypothetical protein
LTHDNKGRRLAAKFRKIFFIEINLSAVFGEWFFKKTTSQAGMPFGYPLLHCERFGHRPHFFKKILIARKLFIQPKQYSVSGFLSKKTV